MDEAVKMWTRKSCFVVLLCLIFVPILSGCAGTGLKGTSAIFAQIDLRQGTGSVFVLRNTGFLGNTSQVDVRLNGLSIGAIGDDEVAIGTTQPGNNVLWADFTSIGLKGSAKVKFTASPSSHHFFVLTQEVSGLSIKRELIEVNETTFKYSL